MAASIEIEELRSLFKDNSDYLSVGVVQSVVPTVERSLVRVKVKLLPDEDLIVARMTWAATGPDAGFFALPESGDLVLVAFDATFGDRQQAFVIARLTSREDTIPLRAALNQDWVLQAVSGKKLNLGSDTGVYIDRGGLVPASEPLVLGNILKTALASFYDQAVGIIDDIIAGPVGIGNIGNPVPIDPTLAVALTVRKTELEADKLVYITTVTTNIVSQIAFTER